MIEGLKISGQYTYDIDNFYQKRFRKPWTLYFPNWETATRDSEGFVTDMELTPKTRGYSSPELQENYERNIRKMGMISANYEKSFGDHSISLFGAYEQLEDDMNRFCAFRKYYISDVVQTIDAGAGADKDKNGAMEN